MCQSIHPRLILEHFEETSSGPLRGPRRPRDDASGSFGACGGVQNSIENLCPSPYSLSRAAALFRYAFGALSFASFGATRLLFAANAGEI